MYQMKNNKILKYVVIGSLVAYYFAVLCYGSALKKTQNHNNQEYVVEYIVVSEKADGLGKWTRYEKSKDGAVCIEKHSFSGLEERFSDKDGDGTIDEYLKLTSPMSSERSKWWIRDEDTAKNWNYVDSLFAEERARFK